MEQVSVVLQQMHVSEEQNIVNDERRHVVLYRLENIRQDVMEVEINVQIMRAVQTDIIVQVEYNMHVIPKHEVTIHDRHHHIRQKMTVI